MPFPLESTPPSDPFYTIIYPMIGLRIKFTNKEVKHFPVDIPPLKHAIAWLEQMRPDLIGQKMHIIKGVKYLDHKDLEEELHSLFSEKILK
jgi:hypothetical protein